MKTVIAIILSCAALGFAQEVKLEQPATNNVKRLASVTWDLSTHKLVWTVEKGSVVDGEFVPAERLKYEVSPDEAFMAYAGEKRAVTDEEAADLHHLLDVLSLYCVESVVWWDHAGDVDQPAMPAPVTKPDHPTQTKPAPDPKSKIVKVAVKMQ